MWWKSKCLRQCALAGLLAVVMMLLVGCGRRVIRLDFVPIEGRLAQEVIEASDASAFTSDKIAMVSVSGMIANTRAGGLLSSGINPVSDFRETLDAIASDDAVKAVVLRINSPGGTVTASDMMYKDLLAFRRKTGKPVVTCMLDVCASGGYYLSCASDYRIAYPTTITGSIGVIMESVNLNGTLKLIGVATEAVKSGPNKDMGSPFKPAQSHERPLSDNDRELIQGLIDQYYEGFKAVVKASPQRIAEADWPMVTDGRVITGRDAARLGLIDEVADLDAAIARAKSLAKIDKARIVTYSRRDETRGSIYASSPVGSASAGQSTVNMVNINLDLGGLLPRNRSEFLYLWTGLDGSGD